MSTPPRRNGVVVTLERLYDELLSTHDDVTVIKVEMGGVNQKVADHSTRITSLERQRWPLPSLSILLAVGALAASLLGR